RAHLAASGRSHLLRDSIAPCCRCCHRRRGAGQRRVLFQGLLRNPLADPYALGVSGGAALGGALGFLLSLSFSFLGFSPVPILAFIGAMVAMSLVYALARSGARAAIVTLLLAGFAVSAIM